jgi:hypothetical protein
VNTENEKAVRDPIAEAIDLLEKSAEPFDKACMLLRAALQSQSNTDGWVMSGWIEFSGGECPVQPGTYVEVKQRRGNTTTAIPAESICWEWYKEPWNKDLDIVAYRIVGYTEAALEKSQQVSNTDGWKLVPVEPTHEMIEAACKAAAAGCREIGIYNRVVAAAPKAPQQVSNTPQDGSQTDFAILRMRGLHPDTVELLERFMEALAEKLRKAEEKYGYSNGWKQDDWIDECRAKLLEHLAKGDPRDVAAYCAFLWHHGERTATPTSTAIAAMVIKQAADLVRESLGGRAGDMLASEILALIPANAEAELEALMMKVAEAVDCDPLSDRLTIVRRVLDEKVE